MTETAETLRALIAAEGPIPVRRFMEICVADYYAHGTAFGTEGDFTTAPEISQIFGELIGLWAAVTWQQMGMPNPVRLVELGPGRGTLMADLLRAARGVPPFAAALDIHIVETSPALKDMQKTALNGARATWHDSLETLPEGPAILIANEFFDALPIDQYEHTADGWIERRVGLNTEGDLTFVTGEPVEENALRAAHASARSGDLAEVSPACSGVMQKLAARIASDGGAALIFDYGYSKSAPGDTLQALENHAYADVLSKPGEIDLTAHVDFEALADAAKAGGAVPSGPMEQGLFLRTLGIEARAQALLQNATGAQGASITSGVRRLIHADEMGTLFKVLAVTAPGQPLPPGFEGP